MRRPHLVIMVKEPHPGRVKTRLARDMGAVEAARWFRQTSLSLIRRVQDPRWHLTLAVSPDREGMQSTVWPPHISRIPQGPGTLGDRMGRIFRNLGSGPLCIVGSDIPGIERQHIKHAFECLGAADAVFGPAPDGGYWLVGLKRSRAIPADLFKNVRWSTRHAMADTVLTMPQLAVHYADTLQDVDTLDDLRMTAKVGRASKRA